MVYLTLNNKKITFDFEFCYNLHIQELGSANVMKAFHSILQMEDVIERELGKTLPKAQRTRGLSSYHKFKQKS